MRAVKDLGELGHLEFSITRLRMPNKVLRFEFRSLFDRGLLDVDLKVQILGRFFFTRLIRTPKEGFGFE